VHTFSTDIEIFNNRTKRWDRFAAVVDTGATTIVIDKWRSIKLGLKKIGIAHSWQINGPLVNEVRKARVRLAGSRAKGMIIEVIVVPIERRFLEPIKAGEECTRPKVPHIFRDKVLVGLNFLEKLSKPDLKDIFRMK
jgi:predicted aspartyl protease